MEALRQDWATRLGVTLTTRFLLDTKPVPVVDYKRSKKYSDFAGSASYGVCASRNLQYCGYKLVLLTTRAGLPVAYELVPAHTDERAAAETVLSVLWHGEVYEDKGFLGGRLATSPAGGPGQPDLDPHSGPSTHAARPGPEPLAPWPTLAHRRHLQRSAAHGPQPGTPVAQNGPRFGHACYRQDDQPLRLVLRRFFGIDVQTYTMRPV